MGARPDAGLGTWGRSSSSPGSRGHCEESVNGGESSRPAVRQGTAVGTGFSGLGSQRTFQGVVKDIWGFLGLESGKVY